MTSQTYTSRQYCVFLAFEVAFIFFLFPETYGKSLEELAFLYEGDQQAEQSRRVVQHADDAPPAVDVGHDRDDYEKGTVEQVSTTSK